MQRSKLTTSIYVAMVFLSGALAGAFATRLYTMRPVKAGTEPASKRLTPEEFRRRYVEDHKARLHLSDEQVTRLQTILDETRARFHEAKQQSDVEMKKIHDDQISQIRGLLTDAQRPEYEKMREERRKHREEREKAEKGKQPKGC